MRIEVDGDVGVPSDAPTVDSGSGSPPKWVIGLGILIVGIVGAVFLLRPAADTAADGTERQAPTTTIVEDESNETEPDGPASDAAGSDLDESTDVDELEVEGEPVVLTPLVLEGGVSNIVAGDLGFFALIGGASNAGNPILFRSVDGEDWFDISTSVNEPEGSDSLGRTFSNLIPLGDRLVLTAINLDGGNAFFPDTSVFVSEAGSEWTELEQFNQGTESSQVFPLAVGESSAFGVEFGPFGVLEDFVAEHTNILVPDVGVCEVRENDFDNNTDYQLFEILDCEGNVVGEVDESSLTSQFRLDEVIGCLNSSLQDYFGVSLRLTRLDLEGNNEPVALGEFAPTDLPTQLSGGGIAGIDGGSPPRDRLVECDGLVEFPDEVEPSVFVADETSDQMQRWPLPDGIELFDAFDLQTVGELEVAGENYLLVHTNDALWTLDTENGEWDGPITPSALPVPTGFRQRVFISESMTRAYVLAEEDVLVTFDFVEGTDGELEIVDTAQPISTEGGDDLSANFAGVIYADDEVLFLADGIEAWSLEAPPLPN